MASNDRVKIEVRQPRDKAERTGVAKTCCASLGITMPMVVDDVNDRVGHLYSGMPDRLYVIDRAGKIAYKGGRGPFGFNCLEMEQALAMAILDKPDKTEKPAPGQGQGRVPLLDDADAWKRLPPAEKGAGAPLPTWARALAGTLPRTTAGMLELDHLHRAKSPLDPALRARLRLAAADANRCDYAKKTAEADLRQLRADAAPLASERAALAFARKLTLAADTVTDEEVADLVKQYGEKQVVAMVLLLAYANFQDRLLLTLGLPLEEKGPMAPLEVRFARPVAAAASPAKPGTAPTATTPASLPTTPDYAKLQEALEEQRGRSGRVRVPTWDEIRPGLPPDFASRGPTAVRWTLVCLGYQPELSAAWLRTMRTFGEEARQDRVLEESLFWVITRSLKCFY